MHYFLNGGGNEIGTITSDTYISKLKELDVKKVLIIPLAIREIKDKKFFERNKIYYKNSFEKIENIAFDVINFHDNLQSVREKLKDTDVIYLTGGIPHILIHRLKKRKIDGLIKEHILSGNLKVLSGGSAGEMTLGEKTIIGHAEVRKIIDGLDFLHGIIFDSHFTNRNRLGRLKEVLQKFDNKYSGIGIDEETVVVFDEKYNIIDTFGKGTATFLKEDKITVYGKN